MQLKNKAKAKAIILSKVSKDPKTKCWLWLDHTDKQGYGRIRVDGKMRYGHRISYHLFVKDIDPQSVVHHICNTRRCINPKHLQMISPHENTAEMFERKSYKKEILRLEKEIEILKQGRCKCQNQ
jgi:hypothetical protein